MIKNFNIFPMRYNVKNKYIQEIKIIKKKFSIVFNYNNTMTLVKELDIFWLYILFILLIVINGINNKTIMNVTCL